MNFKWIFIIYFGIEKNIRFDVIINFFYLLAWKQDPQERITSFMKLLDTLEELYNSIRCMADEKPLCLLPEKNLDLDDDLELPDEDILVL